MVTSWQASEIISVICFYLRKVKILVSLQDRVEETLINCVSVQELLHRCPEKRATLIFWIAL